MRPALAALAVLLAACGGAAPGTVGQHPGDATATPTAEVVSVTDGDTLRVAVDGTEEPVRLIGIDAPERGACYAVEATAALRELVEGEQVALESDTSDRDRYDRLLRYVHVDGTHVNATLVREGFAVARRYPPDTGRAEELEAAEATARSEQVGLWGREACHP